MAKVDPIDPKGLQESPEPRSSHESAIIGDELHLFGGKHHTGDIFPRNEIWTCNVREERKWIRRFVEGKNIPPPCEGARCVVINGIMYSYGGTEKGGNDLDELFGLTEQLDSSNEKNMIWFPVVTPIQNKPWKRAYCSLSAIGKKIVMFGGLCGEIPEDRLQSRAKEKWPVNNEAYGFTFKTKEKGYWSNVELSGERPEPRCRAALEEIDQYRGLLHGGQDGWGNSFPDAFVIDLKEMKWICINFLPKPSARYDHRICRLPKTEFDERNCFILVGGQKRTFNACIFDLDKTESYIFSINPEIGFVRLHTLHCVQKEDGSFQIIVVGGEDWNKRSKEIVSSFTLELKMTKEAYVKIESEKLHSVLMITVSSQTKREEERMRNEWETQRKALEEENTKLSRELEIAKTELRAIKDSQTNFCDLIRHPLGGPKVANSTSRAEPESIASSGNLQHRDTITRSSNRLQDLNSQPAAKKFCDYTPVVDREVEENELKDLASYLPNYWKELGHRLLGEKSKLTIDTLEKKHDPQQCPYAMLDHWHNRDGSHATVRQVCKALLRVDHRKAAEKVFGVDTVRQVEKSI